MSSRQAGLSGALSGVREGRCSEETLESAVEAELSKTGAKGLSRALAAELLRMGADENRVSLIVTGLGWLGGGTQAIEGRLIELITRARRELALVVYSMTSGPARVWDALEGAADGGLRCTLIIDRLDGQDAQTHDRIRALRSRHPATFQVWDFLGEDDNDHLHAKIVVADRRLALVGSANLTAHGLLLAHELAVLVDGPAAEEIAERIDLLTRSRLLRRST